MKAPMIERVGHGIQGGIWLTTGLTMIVLLWVPFGFLLAIPVMAFAAWRTRQNWRFAHRGYF